MNSGGNVILIGMPGAGKSTLGVVLAKILNKQFVDTDLLIQGERGETLQTTIDTLGPEGFIEVENEVLSRIQATESIISTGGSAIYSSEAMGHLGDIGTIVYLEISYESLVDRLGDLHERGVVMRDGVSANLRELYDERLPLYRKFADVVVGVDGLSITDAAQKVAGTL